MSGTTGTPRTPTFLLTQTFQDGQPNSSITPSDERDFVTSVVPWDAVAGTATPYIARGVMDLYNYFLANGGVFATSGNVTNGQGATNATVLQAGINAGLAANKKLFWGGGIYQIYNTAGIVINNLGKGFWCEGAMEGAVLQQNYATSPGAPILTLGDVSGVTQAPVHFIGISLQYGVAQTGFTSSNALVLGSIANGTIGEIYIIGNNGSPPYNGIVEASTAGSFFSNTVRDITVFGWQNDGLQKNSQGTGNTYINVYWNVGGTVTGGSQQAITGNYINFNIAQLQDQTFIRCNFEWGACNTVVNMSHSGGQFYGGSGIVFEGLHVEGVMLTGANPTIFDATGNVTMVVNGFNLVSTYVNSSKFTGQASMLTMSNNGGWGSNIVMNAVCMTTYSAGDINTSFLLLQWLFAGTLWDDQGTFNINSMRFLDEGGGNFTGHVAFDTHMPTANFVLPSSFEKYSYGGKGSTVSKPTVPITSTYTLYGQYEDATLQVPATITSFTITLSPVQAATGTQLSRLSNTVRVSRQTGTTSGTLTVTNGGGAGGNLTAPNTQGTSGWYQMTNGGTGTNNWAIFTPVT